jgi:hypothetical protein
MCERHCSDSFGRKGKKGLLGRKLLLDNNNRLLGQKAPQCFNSIAVRVGNGDHGGKVHTGEKGCEV